MFEQLKIDDKGISTREFWKRQIIVARRQKQPSSFGFYSPAKDGAECEGIINRKKVPLAFQLNLYDVGSVVFGVNLICR